MTTSGRTGGSEGAGVIGLVISEGDSEGREVASVACEGLGKLARSIGAAATEAGLGGGVAKSQGRGTIAAGMILSIMFSLSEGHHIITRTR